MTKKRLVGIPDEILKNLEKKITSQIMNKIDEIISTKCKEIFSHESKNNTFVFKNEIALLKANSHYLQNETKKLNEKLDHTLGSLTYIASEYDDFSTKIVRLKKQSQDVTQEITCINEKLGIFRKRQSETEKQLEELEQYGRRENLEIHGVPWSKNENTNEIVKKVAKQLNVSLISNDISTSHRLFNTNSYSGNFTKTEKNRHPPIIVRFSNRDKRNEIFNQRQKFRENSPSNSDNSNHNNLIPKNVTIRENLTKYRKFLYAEANKVKNKLRYQFLWTWQGQILMRKDATTKAFKISSLQDLNKLSNWSGCNTSRMQV